MDDLTVSGFCNIGLQGRVHDAVSLQLYLQCKEILCTDERCTAVLRAHDGRQCLRSGFSKELSGVREVHTRADDEEYDGNPKGRSKTRVQRFGFRVYGFRVSGFEGVRALGFRGFLVPNSVDFTRCCWLHQRIVYFPPTRVSLSNCVYHVTIGLSHTFVNT